MKNAPPAIPSEFVHHGRTLNSNYYVAHRKILLAYPDPGCLDNAEAAQINCAYQNQFARDVGGGAGVIVVLGSLMNMDPGARRVYSTALDPEWIAAIALLVDSTLARAIGSFFIGITKPKFPTKLVDSIETGAQWLLPHVQKQLRAAAEPPRPRASP
jgi:hypothetical protein